MAVYDLYKTAASPSQAPRFGTFWLYAKVNFAENPMAVSDVARLMKIKDKWVVRDSYWRMTVASTAANTFDIGFNDAGSAVYTNQGILAGGASAAGDWAQGVVDPDANQKICTTDGYIFVENLTAAVYDGVLEVMVEVFAGPDDAEPVDANIDD